VPLARPISVMLKAARGGHENGATANRLRKLPQQAHLLRHVLGDALHDKVGLMVNDAQIDRIDRSAEL
jgi:hypothetical protein